MNGQDPSGTILADHPGLGKPRQDIFDALESFIQKNSAPNVNAIHQSYVRSGFIPQGYADWTDISRL